MFSSAFWIAAGERALKTFGQTLLAALTLSSVSIDVLHVNWVGALSVSLGATLYSVLTSLAGLIPAGSPTPAEAVVQQQPHVPALVPLPAPAPAPAPVSDPEPARPSDAIDPSLDITDALHALDAQDAAAAVVVGGPPAELIPPAVQPSA